MKRASKQSTMAEVIANASVFLKQSLQELEKAHHYYTYIHVQLHV